MLTQLPVKGVWAQATGGGEGAARRAVMDVAERRFEELERQRSQVRPRTVAPR